MTFTDLNKVIRICKYLDNQDLTVSEAEEITKTLKKEVIVSGGWGQESDTCARCQDCEKQLAYSLTNWGVKSELDHFLSKGMVDLSSKEVAYEIEEVLDCYSTYNKQQTRVLELAIKVNKCFETIKGAENVRN